MSALAEKIARDHQRVMNRPGNTCLCDEWSLPYTGDQQPFLRHVAEVTEAAARADERARIAAELRARGLNVMAARVARGGQS